MQNCLRNHYAITALKSEAHECNLAYVYTAFFKMHTHAQTHI
jgi:hypothetical protein